MLSVKATQAGLTIGTPQNQTLDVSWRWVRDHGEDLTSFDPTTKQRRVHALGGAEPAPATKVLHTTIDNLDVVSFDWPEAPKHTWISCATIEQLLAVSPSTVSLWHAPAEVDVSVYEVADVLGDEAVLRSWLTDIATYGFGQLRGFVGSHAEVTALANRIGYVRDTIFGTTWDLASDLDEHDDTAYSESFLAPHTDGTYSHDAPGLQMFCCIDREGTGGESIVVDGFALVETLRTSYPDDFDLLSTVSVPAHYIEPGIELRAERPAIRFDSHGRVIQLSMNNYDRSPMALPAEDMAEFYRAYSRLHELASDPARWLSIRLEAGDVLINNNWRALHGRQAYTGARHFIGCYLNHEDFESRCRTLDIAI